MNFSMAFNAQRDTKIQIEEAGFGPFTAHKFVPQLLKRNLVVMGVKANRLALSALCVAFLAGVMIATEYLGAPSHVRLGLPQDLLLASNTAAPMVSVLSCTLLGVLGLSLAELLRLRTVVRQEVGNPHLGVHVRFNQDRSSTTAFAEMLTLMFLNPAIYALVIGATVISGIGVVFDLPSHREFNCIRFNEGLQAKRVNCWNPDRQANFLTRAISSQAVSTLAEGSSTT